MFDIRQTFHVPMWIFPLLALALAERDDSSLLQRVELLSHSVELKHGPKRGKCSARTTGKQKSMEVYLSQVDTSQVVKLT